MNTRLRYNNIMKTDMEDYNSKKANMFETINTAYLLGVQYVNIWIMKSVTALLEKIKLRITCIKATKRKKQLA